MNWINWTKNCSEALALDPAIAVQELLGGAERGFVEFLGTFDQPEGCAELVMQRIGVVSNHSESAAFRGSLGAESTHNDVSTTFD